MALFFYHISSVSDREHVPEWLQHILRTKGLKNMWGLEIRTAARAASMCPWVVLGRELSAEAERGFLLHQGQCPALVWKWIDSAREDRGSPGDTRCSRRIQT